MPRKTPRWELILIFDRFKGYTVLELNDKLKVKVPISTLYKYHNRYVKADRVARSML